MNILFAVIFILCAIVLLCLSPDTFFSILLDGASKAATTCLALLASYAVWMGLIKVWEDCGIAQKVAKLVKPAARKLLKTEDGEALNAVSMNLSVNLLGISGAATPYGVKAANLLDRTENAEYSSAMFFVLNATSLQILPASMVTVRASFGSGNPTDIILPTLLTTVFSTLLGVVLTAMLLRPKKARVYSKIRGACTS
jgi:spore maturation protein A